MAARLLFLFLVLFAGAVLLYLAEHGLDADGTDLSAEMCRVAAAKAEAKGLHLNIIPADMTRFSSGRKYSLAIIARSGFMHLPDQRLQEAALRNLRDQLLPGGILTLNTFDPWPPMQAAQMQTTPEDYSFRLEYTNRAGRRSTMRLPTTRTRSKCTATGNLWSIMTGERLSGNGSAPC